MIEAISNLLLVALAVSAAALWIHGLVNSDGKCHFVPPVFSFLLPCLGLNRQCCNTSLAGRIPSWL